MTIVSFTVLAIWLAILLIVYAVLTSEYASLVALEFNRNPVINDEAAFDIYPPYVGGIPFIVPSYLMSNCQFSPPGSFLSFHAPTSRYHHGPRRPRQDHPTGHPSIYLRRQGRSRWNHPTHWCLLRSSAR